MAKPNTTPKRAEELVENIRAKLMEFGIAVRHESVFESEASYLAYAIVDLILAVVNDQEELKEESIRA